MHVFSAAVEQHDSEAVKSLYIPSSNVAAVNFGMQDRQGLSSCREPAAAVVQCFFTVAIMVGGATITTGLSPALDHQQ